MTDNIYAHLTEEDYANEEWRDIKNYEGLYQVSSLGRIKSLERVVYCGVNYCSKKTIKHKFLNLTKKNSYLNVGLRKDGLQEFFLVHRLVAVYFLENKNCYPVVNHIDGNKVNNKKSNLEWCTYSQNSIHAWDSGLCDDARKRLTGTNNHQSKLSDIEIKEIKELYCSSSITQKKISEIYGISHQHVSDILNGKRRAVKTPVLELA